MSGTTTERPPTDDQTELVDMAESSNWRRQAAGRGRRQATQKRAAANSRERAAAAEWGIWERAAASPAEWGFRDSATEWGISGGWMDNYIRRRNLQK